MARIVTNNSSSHLVHLLFFLLSYKQVIKLPKNLFSSYHNNLCIWPENRTVNLGLGSHFTIHTAKHL